MTEIKGKVTGIGPDLVEVDAAFVPGNSGSPIIHVKTGKIIGIATFATIKKMDGFGKDSKFNNVERRFGYRLDNVSTWRETTWPAFSREASLVSLQIKRTSDIWDLAKDISQNGEIKEWTKHLARDNTISKNVGDFQKALSRGSNVAFSYYIDEKNDFCFGFCLI